MKGLHKRIISSILAIVTLFFACVPPSYASSLETLPVVADIWDWILAVGNRDGNFLRSLFDKDVCPESTKPDGLHNFKEQRTTIDGKTGLFYICEYCGKSAGEVGEEAYQQQVAELPATGFSSDGTLLYTGTVDYVYAYSSGNGLALGCPHYPRNSSNSAANATFDCDANTFRFIPKSGNSSIIFNQFFAYYYVEFPLDGYYQRLTSTALSGYYMNGSESRSFEELHGGSALVFYSAGHSLTYYSCITIKLASTIFLSGQAYAPVYKVTPLSSVDTGAGGQYNITTRPTTITGGNYGIVGDDNKITTITTNNKIVNETNNTYYNPATGQTSTIVDWSYNYDGRIYDITLDTGDKVQVEYGDQNITITENNVVEGDTIVNNYTIYYMIDGTGSGDNPSPVPTACPHDWQETARIEPACTAPGKVNYSCSQCGQTKTEAIPALGHDWQVLRTVPTEYDEDGVQTQAGYTLYECTRCGEQYKDEGGTGPPSVGPTDGGLLEFLNGIIKYLSDNLSGAVALLRRFFSEIPGLFSGFTAFLAAVFPFLPDEIILLLTFGMAALVFVGIIKEMRRRW